MDTQGATYGLVRGLAAVLLLATTVAGQLVADFSADVTVGPNPLTVQFSDQSTGATPSAWIWDFGDGATGLGQAPSHTYTTPGRYDVELTVLAGLQGFDSIVKQGFITVELAPQVTAFSATPTSGENPLTVQFSDTSSGAIDAWLWDFGDGGSSTEQHPVHVFSADAGPGPTLHTVSLTTFIGGQSQTLVQPDLISVSPAPLQADFTAQVTAGTNPLQVQFIDRSIGPVDAWHWDFGDGGTQDVQQGFHIFSVEDNATTSWDVTLTVSVGDQQSTVTKPAFVTVEPAVMDLALELGPTAGVGFLNVHFENASELPEGTQVTWDLAGTPWSFAQADLVFFPDGGAPASYDVSLTAQLWNQVETLVLEDALTVAPKLLGDQRVIEPAFLSIIDVAPVDWDEDGDLDVVTVDAQASVLRLHDNTDGLGALGPAQLLADGVSMTQVEPVDLDDDGHTDLFLRGPYGLSWLPGGPGAAPLQEIVAPASPLQDHDLADVDGDGDLDIVGAAFDVGGLQLQWRPNLGGAAAFGAATTILPLDFGGDIVAGDLDGDGDADVVHADPLLQWLENQDGAGTSWQAHPFAPEITFVDDLHLTDLERDGDLDLLVATKVGGAGTVAYALNVGPGQFAFVQSTALLSQQRLDQLGTADLDGDGDDEILAVSWWVGAGLSLPGQVVWYEDLDGQLDFAPGELAAGSRRAYTDLEVADLDGDGDPDLLAARNDADSVTWVENTLRTPVWEPLGPRLAGSAGPPLLQAFGALAPGQEVTLALSNTLPGAAASLVLGTSELSAPFRGGVLVPEPEVLVPLVVGPAGDLLVQATWPGGIPAGLPVLTQAWIVDGAAPQGLAASNGLSGLTSD